MKSVLFFLIWGTLVSCASPPPYEDYTLARTALKAARESEAPRYAPIIWSQAELEFRQGEKSYNENGFDEAKRHFQTSIRASEKAENSARMKKFTTGGSAP